MPPWGTRGGALALWVVLSLILAAGCSGADPAALGTNEGAAVDDSVATLSSDLALLFAYEPGTPFDGAEFEGTLILDFPCVYGESQIGDAMTRVAIALPNVTEYDAATNSVRVGDGPWLTTGDQVRGGGGSSTPQAASLCPAGETFRSTFLEAASS